MFNRSLFKPVNQWIEKSLTKNIPMFFKDNFSSFRPHTKDYVNDQIQALKAKNLSAERVNLPKDTELVGLNINPVETLIHDAPPLCRRTDAEKVNLKDIHPLAQLKIFTVTSNIECASTKPASGPLVFFVHASKTTMHEGSVTKGLSNQQIYSGVSYTAGP